MQVHFIEIHQVLAKKIRLDTFRTEQYKKSCRPLKIKVKWKLNNVFPIPSIHDEIFYFRGKRNNLVGNADVTMPKVSSSDIKSLNVKQNGCPF